MGQSIALKAPRRTSQTEEAYKSLKRHILENTFAAGSQWLEAELAAKLGVSRTPVREAMIRLVNEGLVEVRSRHGMRVLPVSYRDMQEIYQIFAELEPTAARLLAEKGATEVQLAAMEQAVGEMETALETEDLQAWAAADERFHRLVLRWCGNRRLAAVMANLWDQGHRVQMLTLKSRPRPFDSMQEHRDLLQAIRERDAAKAYEIHKRHRIRVNAMLLDILDKLGFGEL
jgi:DNA-binding GntR family transcriptional regulator